MQVTIVIPTRNRGRLALTALASVLDQLPPRVRILVSDNSTDPAERALLAADLQESGRAPVSLVSPPGDLAMSDHWEWAVERALAAQDASHVAVLTDRMVFRDGSLGELVDISARHPRHVISYSHDAVLDMDEPVRVSQAPWSGRLFELETARLARLAAQSQFHESLPRMLNCIVPREAFAALRDRFGTVFGSPSPDFSFAFRCLAVLESIAYYDRACLVNHALATSTGHASTRGVLSPELRDLWSRLGAEGLNAAAPVPGFRTLRNSMAHEYCVVRALDGGERLPPLDRDAYLAMIERDASAMVDPGARARTRQLLRREGWRGVRRLRHRVAYAAGVALEVGGPGEFLHRGARFLLDASGPLSVLGSAALRPPTFPTPGEALEAARNGQTQPKPGTWHLRRLVKVGGPLRELDGPPPAPARGRS